MSEWRDIETAPRDGITYGQTLAFDGGRLSISGCSSPDEALWRAAHLSRLPARDLRKVLTKTQRQRLLDVAQRKLASGSSNV